MTEEQYNEAESFWTRKDETEKKMDRDSVYKWINDFLFSHKVLALATDPKRQRRGIGKMLLGEAVRISRDRGDQVMRLDTLTWNVPGQRLYEGFGFHCCGDVELDYPSTGKIPFRMYEYRVSYFREE